MDNKRFEDFNPIQGNKSMTSEVKMGGKISFDEPVGYLFHKPTRANIAVYERIGWFKRLMLRWCFGLEYRKV